MKQLTLFIFAIIAIMATASASVFETERYSSVNLNKSIDAIQDGNLDEAQNYLELELMENPNNGYAHHLMGAIYYELCEYGKSLSHAHKAIRLIPKTDYEFYAGSFSLRSQIYTALGDTAKAIEDAFNAIVIQPSEIIYYSNRAQIYYDLGDYEKSNADYEKIIALDETDVVGYMGLGRNFYDQEKYQQAISQFNYATRLDPNYHYAYSWMACCYTKLREYNNAVDNIIKAIESGSDYGYDLMATIYDEAYDILITKLKSQCKKHTEDVMWFYLTACAFYDNKDYINAIEYYKQAGEIEYPAFFNKSIAECYIALGDYKSALKYCDKAIKLSKEEDSSYFMLIRAEILYEMGKPKKAIEEISKYIDAIPDYFEGYCCRGFYKDNLHDIEGAIADYSMSIKLNPNFAYSYFGRADMYKLKGDTALANADYRKVLELDTIPQDGACAQYAFLELGMTDKAIDFMNQIIENEPDNSGHYYDAACVYARLGNTAKSLEYLEIALKMGYKSFHHMSIDDNLDTIRNLPQYKNLIRQYKK